MSGVEPKCPDCGASGIGAGVRDCGVYAPRKTDDPALEFASGSFGTIDLGKHKFECLKCGALWIGRK